MANEQIVPTQHIPDVPEVKEVEMVKLDICYYPKGAVKDLADIISRMPIYDKERMPLPHSAAHMFLNCCCQSFIKMSKVDYGCPIFQLGWYALNGLLHKETYPAIPIVPDKKRYTAALDFLMSVGATKEVIELFEHYYTVKVCASYSKECLKDLFHYYSSVTIGSVDECGATVYNVCVKEKCAEIYYPAYGSRDKFIGLDNVVDTVFELLSKPEDARYLSFGSSDEHIYQPLDPNMKE